MLFLSWRITNTPSVRTVIVWVTLPNKACQSVKFGISEQAPHGLTISALWRPYHFMQSVKFTVAFLNGVLSAIHQHVNPEDLERGKFEHKR